MLLFWIPTVDKPEDAVKMNPGLKAITAVQAGFVYNFPSVGQWTFPIPQSAMGVLWLSEKLYPDLYEDLDEQLRRTSIIKISSV